VCCLFTCCQNSYVGFFQGHFCDVGYYFLVSYVFSFGGRSQWRREVCFASGTLPLPRVFKTQIDFSFHIDLLRKSYFWRLETRTREGLFCFFSTKVMLFVFRMAASEPRVEDRRGANDIRRLAKK
jgi:hypothetical protein